MAESSFPDLNVMPVQSCFDPKSRLCRRPFASSPLLELSSPLLELAASQPLAYFELAFARARLALLPSELISVPTQYGTLRPLGGVRRRPSHLHPTPVYVAHLTHNNKNINARADWSALGPLTPTWFANLAIHVDTQCGIVSNLYMPASILWSAEKVLTVLVLRNARAAASGRPCPVAARVIERLESTPSKGV